MKKISFFLILFTTYSLFAQETTGKVRTQDKYSKAILEINKGPDMKHKDEADRLLKKKVIFDTFNLMNVVKAKNNDYKNMFRKLL